MKFFRVTAERLQNRAEFFRVMGNDFAADPLMVGAGVNFDEDVAPILSQAYFMLSESYRSYRSEPEHFTNLSKIAAITCATVCALDPLRPAIVDFAVPAVRYANPIFAMRCASSIVEHPYHLRAFDERRRVYDKLLGTRFPCLDDFISDAQNGVLREPEEYNKSDTCYSIGLSRQEMVEIEGFVAMFTVLQQQKIVAAAQIG